MSAANDVEHLVGRLSTLIFWKIPRFINTRSLLNRFQYLVPILRLLRLHHLNRTAISGSPVKFATDFSIADLNSVFILNTSLSFPTSLSFLADFQQPTFYFVRVCAVRDQTALVVLREALSAQRTLFSRARYAARENRQPVPRRLELIVRFFRGLR